MTTRPGYIWSGTEWVAIGQEAVLAPISYQTSAPSSPATGDVWIDSNDDVPSVNSTLYYRWKKTAAGGETSFTGTDDNSLTLAYTAGYESVFINGVLQVRGSDYTATTGTSITGLTALTAGDIVMVESVMAYSVGDTYTQSVLDGKFSPITTTGAVLVYSGQVTMNTSVTISNVFSSTYDNYLIEFSGVSSVPSSSEISFRFNNGSDLSTSIYSYNERSSYSGFDSNVTTASATSYHFARIDSTTPKGCGGNLFVKSPFLTQQKVYHGMSFSKANSGNNISFIASGFCDTTTSCTGFSLINASSGATVMNIKVYGYK